MKGTILIPIVAPRVKVYVAKAMTGRTGLDLLTESAYTTIVARRVAPSVRLLDPVVEEDIRPSEVPVKAPARRLTKFWARDKEMIRDAHVLFDITGPKKSEGVAHEIGYARFFLYKPVVRLWPGLQASVARIEGDLIVETLEEGFKEIEARWGTPGQRLWFKIALLRKVPKSFWYKLREWLNIF